MFRFPNEYRETVKHIATAMMNLNVYHNVLANATLDILDCGCREHGAYGHLQQAIMKIIAHCAGAEVIGHMPEFNFGGNATWLHDVETAVQEGLDEMARIKQDNADFSEMVDKMMNE